jgi:hypothetical protein
MKRVGLTDDWYNESLIEYVLYLNWRYSWAIKGCC